jgi:hypothetical protein
MTYTHPNRRWCGLALAACLSLALPVAATVPSKPAATSTHKVKSLSTSKPHATSHATSHVANHAKAKAKTASYPTQAHKSQARKSATLSAKNSRGKKGTKKPVARGQLNIDPTRTREIQEALIRQHYLDGEATGSWDSATQDAMHRFQQDSGWQSKAIPDSRALIKLGLGPSKEHLLNPDSAMTPMNADFPASDREPAAKPSTNPNPPTAHPQSQQH